MTTMRVSGWLGMALVALGATACDPFPEETKAAPQILRVLVFDGQASATLDPVFAPEPAGSATYTLAGIDPVMTADGGMYSVLSIQFNTVLDGTSIQAAPDDCTPATGSLTVTGGTLGAGEAWYTCYYPSSAVIDTGASIYVFKATDQTDLTTALLDSGATYTISGQVKGQGGQVVSVSVRVTTL